MPNFIEIEKNFLWTDRCTHVRSWTEGHLRLTLLGRLCQRVDLKKPPNTAHSQLDSFHMTIDDGIFT